jgi:hypothetical protein
VLGLGHELVLFHPFHDSYPEGYTALRAADIKRVRSDKHERFWEAMLRGEGLVERVGISNDVPLDDFRSLLGALHARGQSVSIGQAQPGTSVARPGRSGADGCPVAHFDGFSSFPRLIHFRCMATATAGGRRGRGVSVRNLMTACVSSGGLDVSKRSTDKPTPTKPT